MLHRLIQVDELNDVTGTVYNGPYFVGNARQWSVQSIIDVNTGTAKTFDSGSAKNCTFSCNDPSGITAGDYVIIPVLTADGTQEEFGVYADNTGSDPEPTGASWLDLPVANRGPADLSGAVTGTDVSQAVVDAFNALTGFTALCTLTDPTTDETFGSATVIFGTVDSPETYQADGTLAGTLVGFIIVNNPGSASEVNLADSSVAIPSHGYYSGLIGQLTTTDTLPGGLAVLTNYYIIVLDSGNVSFASSYANAIAGTAITLTDQGASGSTNTFTPTAFANASIKVQISNEIDEPLSTDTSAWTDNAAATAIVADATLILSDPKQEWCWMQVVMTLTAGSMSIENRILVRGDQP